MITREYKPDTLIGDLQKTTGESYLPDATWYLAQKVGDGLEYCFDAGTLLGAKYITADMLLTGKEAGVFVLALQEGESGATFHYQFSLMPEASARLRMPIEATNMNRWMFPREGALLKPRVGGQRVDITRVDRMRIVVYMKADDPVKWCMTPFQFTPNEPALIEEPLLPKGVLLDELGQSAHLEWEGKSRSREEVNQRLQQQLQDAPDQKLPNRFSKWGGWTGRQYDASGFFRTQWDDENNRWWLIDPDGYVFWSAGQDCVGVNVTANFTNMENALTWLPKEDEPFAEIVRERGQYGGKYINYLQANLMHAFGHDWHDKWAEITIGELKRAGLNTVANWSEWQIARDAGFPYVRPMGFPRGKTPTVYRELPDVFDPQFEIDAADFAQQLEETRDDPALIGYFMMNEPTWGFSSESPAAGMLFNTVTCESRKALADFLRDKYTTDAVFSAAWDIDTTFATLANSEWNTPLTDTATNDLNDFSSIMVEKYFGTLSKACREADPNHLNLGIRYHTVPPQWALDGMRSFDVFSINCYRAQVPPDQLQAIHDLLNMPTLVGEWHMGALDVGLPATGVGPRVKTQADRARAYRYYLETAAVIPHCVGVHHFTHYDQSALGRFDGEAYNIGFYDICNRPYEVLVNAARESHAKMYQIGLGEAEPYGEEPIFLGRFFF